MAQEVLEVQHGIWIDEQLIRNAGLGGRLRVVVEPGEIRILPGTVEAAASEQSAASNAAQGWEVFRRLGDDAPSGSLPNAAEEHDRYLYGKNRPDPGTPNSDESGTRA